MESETAMMASSFFSGGFAGVGSTCGALSGGIMALGMKYGRANPRQGSVQDGSGAALKLFNWFQREYGTTLCHDLIGIPNFFNQEERAKFAVSEGHLKCSRRLGEVAAKVMEIVGELGERRLRQEEAVEELKGKGLL